MVQNMHQGYPAETLIRFLKARDWNVGKAHKMVSKIGYVWLRKLVPILALLIARSITL